MLVVSKNLANATVFHPDHSVANFPVLAGEFEPSSMIGGTALTIGSVHQVNWLFGNRSRHGNHHFQFNLSVLLLLFTAPG
jgi:hypothetical protein